MFGFEKFSIAGDKRKTLKDVMRFLMETQGFHPTETGYGTLENQEKGKVLVIGEHLDPSHINDIMRYPFQMTPETLAEQIEQFIHSVTVEDLKTYGVEEEDFAYAEEYVIGWDVFRPDRWDEGHGIGFYCLFDTIAVKPVIIEYGK